MKQNKILTLPIIAILLLNLFSFEVFATEITGVFPKVFTDKQEYSLNEEIKVFTSLPALAKCDTVNCDKYLSPPVDCDKYFVSLSGKEFKHSYGGCPTDGSIAYSGNVPFAGNWRAKIVVPKEIRLRNPGMSDEYTSYQFKVTGPTPFCADSDGGKNYYLKGEVPHVQGYPENVDNCINEKGIVSSEGKTLLEYFCVTENEKKVWTNEKYECQNGCKNGACIATQSTVSEPTVLKGTFSLQGQEFRLFVTMLSTNYPLFIFVSKDSINKVRAEKVSDISINYENEKGSYGIYETKWNYKGITYRVQLNTRNNVATISVDTAEDVNVFNTFSLKEIPEQVANDEIYTSQMQQYVQQRNSGRCDVKEIIDTKSPAVQCLEKLFDKNKYDYDREVMIKCNDRTFRQMPEFVGCDDNHMVPLIINCIRQAKPEINAEIDACLQFPTTSPRQQPVTPLPPTSPDVEQRIQAIERQLKEQQTILQKILDFFKRIFGG